jgi:hypothetical protein
MEILAVQVVGQLIGKGFDLLELCFAKCKRHWFSLVVLSVIRDRLARVVGNEFLPLRCPK